MQDRQSARVEGRRGAAGSISSTAGRHLQRADRARSVIRLPSFDQVAADPVLYAHASRILHLETNPGNARALVQRHGDGDLWLNPPPLPLTTRGTGSGSTSFPTAAGHIRPTARQKIPA